MNEQPAPASPVNPRRWLALAVICAAELMIVLDVTIVTIAGPQIQDGLDMSRTGLAWVINAYLLTFGGLLLLAGRAADLLGSRRLFMAGLIVFTAASLLCGVSISGPMLIGARAVQGVGGAIVTAVALALLVINFPDATERAKAMGIWGFVASAGGSVGVTLGGILTDVLDWRSIFLINIPIGIAATIMAGRSLNRDPSVETRGRIDVAGAVLVTAAGTLLAYAVIGAQENGWGSGRTLALFGTVIALIVALVLVERSVEHPIIPLHLFRSRNLTTACLVSIFLVVGLFSWFFMGTLYMQNVLGRDALHTGIVFLPATAIMGGLSLGPVAGLVRRFGPKPVLAVGLAVTVAGLALMSRVGVDTTIATGVLPAMMLTGLGVGLSFMPLFLLAVAEVEQAQAGVSSGLLSTSQQLGGAIGIAALVALAAARTEATAGEGTLQSLSAGYRAAFLAGAVCALVAIPLSLWLFRGGRNVAGGAASH